MEQVVGLKFTGNSYFDANANNGLGEQKAYFLVVREGHEQDAADKMRAFSSAGVKGAVRIKDGVIALSRRQIEQRIKQLKEKLGEGEK